MIGLTPEQRDQLSDKLADAANLALGGLVFGQFLADRPFSVLIGICGFAAWATLLVFAMLLGGNRR